MEFSDFDQREYPTVKPGVGYGEWAPTYETSVPALLDIGILERIQSVPWSETRQCLDLACGTGRTGAWLASKGVSCIEGIDLTREMLAQAANKRLYRRLHEGSIEKTGLSAATYDLLVMSLADEHLEQLTHVSGSSEIGHSRRETSGRRHAPVHVLNRHADTFQRQSGAAEGYRNSYSSIQRSFCRRD